ncbi:MAG: hypothetical protein ACHQ1D_09035 [Nitrososphaerales archaeon]
MRVFFITIFVILFVATCTNSKQSLSVAVIQPDTVYGGDFIWRAKREDKRLTIRLDNGEDSKKPVFKINEITPLRIRISRLSKYEMFFSDIVGAEIMKVDTAENVFAVIPTDSVFSFRLNQYYPKGQVVRHIKQWNGEKGIYEEHTIPENGFKSVGEIEFRTQ